MQGAGLLLWAKEGVHPAIYAGNRALEGLPGQAGSALALRPNRAQTRDRPATTRFVAGFPGHPHRLPELGWRRGWPTWTLTEISAARLTIRALTEILPARRRRYMLAAECRVWIVPGTTQCRP